jgi:hypothetical protein
VHSFLVANPGLVPVDDVGELPRILAQLELKLSLFVDDQLGRREKDAVALVFVRIVDLDLAGGQVAVSGPGIVISLAEFEALMLFIRKHSVIMSSRRSG